MELICGVNMTLMRGERIIKDLNFADVICKWFLSTKLTVVENTADVHNVVVCTLCSCYPIAILGLSPAWYKSRTYRERDNSS